MQNIRKGYIYFFYIQPRHFIFLDSIQETKRKEKKKHEKHYLIVGKKKK